MRDYKLRKKVFNEYPTTAEVQNMIEAGGGGSGGNEWKEDIEFAITLGNYDSTREAQSFSNPSKTLSDFQQLGDVNELNGKKVLFSMNDSGVVSTYKCVIISYVLDGSGNLSEVLIMPDISAYPLVIDSTTMSNLPLNNAKIYAGGSAFIARYDKQSTRCIVAYASQIAIGTIEGYT